MAQVVSYIASDYDESARPGIIRLGLQDLALSANSVDVVLTPHVPEHVPDTGRVWPSSSELWRRVGACSR
jgi:hypothetical protein